MDTSETYIKMCEKSEEIQGQRVAAWHMMEANQVYFYDGDDVWFAYTVGEGLEQKLNKVWIPRQDQLQEMVKGEKHMHLLAYEFASYFHGTVDPLYAYLGMDNFTVDADNSMEQMWLAFVMKKKYNKIWDGNSWINTTE